MNRIIVPALDEINNLIDPFPQKFLDFIYFLNRVLPLGWEIYVQPYLNAEKPDLVIVHKDIGVMFIDYFDRKREEIDVRIKKSHSDDRSYLIRELRTTGPGNREKLINPTEILDYYQNDIVNIYIPDIYNECSKDPETLKVVKKAVFCPLMTSEEAKNVFSDNDDTLFLITKDLMSEETFLSFILNLSKDKKYIFKPEWYKKLIFWFNPPFHSKEHGVKLILHTKQKQYINSVDKKWQRFKGIAGCGKSLVLAIRAASVASENKKVLILTYNVTLINYMYELLHRAYVDYNPKCITVLNYHMFCSRYLRYHKENWPTGDDKNKFDKAIPNLVSKHSINENESQWKYDAIIIDEGQDFAPEWIDSVTPLLTSIGQVLIAGDDNQDIYGKGTANLEKIKRGFRGEWGQLDFCYRLSERVVQQANKFVEQYIIGGEQIKHFSKKGVDTLYETQIYWANLPETVDCYETIYSIIVYFESNSLIHKEDIVILIPDYRMGKSLSKSLEQKGIQTVKGFGDRGHKSSFAYESWRLKISTIQSFKGWEYHTVIILTPDDAYKKTDHLDKLIYTGLTRAIKNLIVLNRHSKYSEFPDFDEWEKLPEPLVKLTISP